MLISTRGRYALRFMIDLAENQDYNNSNAFISTREVATRQNVSLKYAERLFGILSSYEFVHTQRGKGGGYRLNRAPEDYTVTEILLAMDEDLSPVSCMKCDPNKCERASKCKTLPMWRKLGSIINSFFDGITIADLVSENIWEV